MLGTANGILNKMPTWSQFITTTFQGFTESDINKECEISVRSAAKAQSIGSAGGQGFTKRL